MGMASALAMSFQRWLPCPLNKKDSVNGDLGYSLCHWENCHPSLILGLFFLTFKVYAYLHVCVYVCFHMTVCHVCGVLGGQRGYQVLSNWSSVL